MYLKCKGNQGKAANTTHYTLGGSSLGRWAIEIDFPSQFAQKPELHLFCKQLVNLFEVLF